MALPYITAQGLQPEQLGEQPSNLAKIGFVGAGIAATGFIPTKTGRLWDKYLRGIRAAETAFPAAILRTFRISEFLSPFESWTRLAVPAEQMVVGDKYAEFLRNIFGPGTGSISMVRKGTVFGDIIVDGKTVGMGLRIKAGTQKGVGIADYFARITGTTLGPHQSLNEALLKAKYIASEPFVPYRQWLEAMEPSARRRSLILGVKFRDKVKFLGQEIMISERMKRHLARVEVYGQLMRAKAASTVGRLNTLLSKPFEFLPEGARRLPFIKSMAVKPGSALQMASRYMKKAIIAGAVWKGLEYYDYARSEGGVWATALGTAGGAAAGGFLFKGAGRRFSPIGLVAGAAVGLYTSLAPRFDEGLFHGVASVFTDLSLARAKASQAIGLTESLQRQEDISPGLLSLKTAVGFGGVGMMASGLVQYGGLLRSGISETRATKGGIIADIFEKVREARTERMGRIWETRLGKKVAKLPGGKLLSRVKHPMALGFLGGLAAWGILSTGVSLLSGNVGAAIPGANLLGTTETPEELEAIYSGEEEVAIRKGRWWEFGRSSGYEGGRIEYYRPHFIHRLKTRAYQKGIYGDEAERWEHDPMLHPLKALMGDDEWKYHYEQKYQYERPAPLTSTYFEDVPFFGPLLAATLGKMIKPRKLIRPEEWMIGEGEYKHLPDIRGETEPAYELGGLRPGAPVAPEEGSQLFNELMYRRREAVGLVGFAEGAIEKAVTGREEIFQNLQTIGTMGKETGSEYWLWSHLNIGGGLGTSEPIRRFIPHSRRYLETYNPLENTAIPSWMPQDYFLDLAHGNPFQKIKEAEIRLPGPGYAALHPEVKDLHPEQYPLVHRLKILGDTAMWSSEYKSALAKAKKNMHLLSGQERSIVKTTEEQVKSKKQRRKITEYRFRPELLEEQEITVTEVLDPRRIKAAEFGDMVIELQGMGAIKNMGAAMEFARDTMEGKKITIQTPSMESRKFDIGKDYGRMKAVAMLGSTDYGQVLAQKNLADAKELRGEFEQLRFTPTEHLAGRLSESILHGMETPMELLTPVSPAAKLIRRRSAIEEYIQTEAIGTGSAFWDKPIENFLKPAANIALHQIGFSQIPKEVRQRRDINEYFDMLAWTKSEHAEKLARQVGDLGEIRKQQEIQQKTLFGLDVFGPPTDAMRALPRRERDFFAAFVETPTLEERQQIVSLIPENEQRVYIANWMRQEEQAARAKKEAGIGTRYDDQTLSAAQVMRKSEGFGITPDLEEQWMEETGGKIPYDEWIRTKKAEEYFATHSLPGADWLGWHPSVDLDDVKLKYVEQAGLDHHDFDLWGSRQRSLSRKPYISAEMITQMGMQANFDEVAKTRSNAKAIGGFYSGSNAKINISQIAAPLDESYNIEIVDAREGLVRNAYKYFGVR